MKPTWAQTATDPEHPTPALSHGQQRLGDALVELNARIARLAIGLGISLQNDNAVTQALSRTDDPVTRANRRHALQRDELRGLLVLRYGMQARCVQRVGRGTTWQILCATEAHLESVGFLPGASGNALDRLFNES